MKKLTEPQRKLLRKISVDFAFGRNYKYAAKQHKSIEVLRGMNYITIEKINFERKEGEARINIETMMVDDQLNEVVQSVRQCVKDIKEKRRLVELERWENLLYLMDKYRIVDNRPIRGIYSQLEKKDIDIWCNVSIGPISEGQTRARIYRELKELSL